MPFSTLFASGSSKSSNGFDTRIFGFFIAIVCVFLLIGLIAQLRFDDVVSSPLLVILEGCLGPLLCRLAMAEHKVNRGAWVCLFSIAGIFLMYWLLLCINYFQIDSFFGVIDDRWDLVVPVCLALYSILALLRIKDNVERSIKDEMVLVLGAIFMMIASVQIMVLYCQSFLSMDMVVDYKFFFIVLLMASVIATVIYDNKINRESSRVQDLPVKYAKSILSIDQFQQYHELVEEFLVKKEGFKRKDLSIRLLSTELEIPRHVFSQFFNIHLQKSFYQYVAELRIAYAVKKLQTRSFNFTVEALAEDCGFNSKTSFNKYFKEQMGVTPKEFAQIESFNLKGA